MCKFLIILRGDPHTLYRRILHQYRFQAATTLTTANFLPALIVEQVLFYVCASLDI